MSDQSEETALREGHECAMSALTVQRRTIDSLNPADRLHWWLGFVAAAMGAALSSVGEPGFGVLRSALGEDPEEAAVQAQEERMGAGVSLRKKRSYIKR